MTSYRLSRTINALWLGASLVIIIHANGFSQQLKVEDWQDPVDIGVFDLGDNKLLLYNLIGVGLVHLFSDKTTSIKGADTYTQFHFDWYREYRKPSQPTVFDLKYRVGKKWKKGLWVGSEAISYLISDRSNYIGGLGFSPYFAWNIVNSHKVRLSFDSGVGPVYFFETFPEGGTRFNFSTTYSLDLEVELSQLHLSVGARNTHFSNAFIAGMDRNPAFDGFGLYLGLRLR